MAIGKPLELSELVRAFKRPLQPFLGAGRSSIVFSSLFSILMASPKLLGLGLPFKHSLKITDRIDRRSRPKSCAPRHYWRHYCA
jgi:hypothetical protein